MSSERRAVLVSLFEVQNNLLLRRITGVGGLTLMIPSHIDCPSLRKDEWNVSWFLLKRQICYDI